MSEIATTTGFAIQPAPVRPDQKQYTSVPYIGHRSTAGDRNNEDRAAELDAVGIECPSYYLFAGEPIRLKPFQAHLLKLDRFFTRQSPSGELVAAFADPAKDDQAARDAGFREHLFCIFAVVTGPGKFVAATAKFRSAQCRGINWKVVPAIEKFNPALSDNHAAASKAVHPGGRTRATLWSNEEGTDNGTMIVGYASTRATPAEEVEAFNTWYSVATQLNGELMHALAAHERYVGEVRDLIAGRTVKQIK